MSFKKVLVAIDGSEWSTKALEKAVEYVQVAQAELYIVHVINTFHSSYYHSFGDFSTAAYNFEKDLNEMTKRQGELLLEDVKKGLETRSIQANYALLDGPPSKVICEYGQENGMDLIVIGSRGLSGIKELMLGSVSHKVSHMAECPVLIVK